MLLRYFLVTYFVTWTSWGTAYLVSGGSFARPGPWMVFLYLGTFSPGFVALWFTARREGRAGVGALLRRLVQLDVKVRWYVFALTYMAAIKLAAALIHRVATGAWPRFGDEAWYLMLGATLLSMIVFGQAGEELGWRGYALPRLAARIGLARAGILIGIIWAAWHLPLFFIPGIETTGQSFPLYLIQVTALSVAITWLYAHTSGSLFLTMLMHSAINNTKDIVPAVAQTPGNPFALSTSLLSWIGVGLLWLTAAYFLARMPQLPGRHNGHYVEGSTG